MYRFSQSQPKVVCPSDAHEPFALTVALAVTVVPVEDAVVTPSVSDRPWQNPAKAGTSYA
jgi:hypothetical protein